MRYIGTAEGVATDVNLFDGEIENGNIDSATGANVATANTWRSKNYTDIGDEKELYLMFADYVATGTLGRILYFNSNKSIISNEVFNSTNFKMTIPNSCRYIRFFFNTAITSDNNKALSARIKVAKKATPYSQYRHGTVEVISENGEQRDSLVIESKPLYTEEDKIDLDNQKIIRKFEKKTLNGSENWEGVATVTSDTNCISFYRFNPEMTYPASNDEIANMQCQTFPVVSRTEAGVIQGECVGKSSTESFFITILKSKLATLDIAGLKAYLAKNPITYIYELTTAKEESINCSNKIKQFDGQTTFYERSGAKMNLTTTNNKAVAELNENMKRIEENSTRNVITLSNTTEQTIAQTVGTTIILDNIVAIGNKLSANNNSIVVGSGVRKVLISANLNLQDLTASKSLQLALQQNNVSGQAKKILKAHNYSNGALGFLNIGNVLLDVEEGDSFSLLTYNGCTSKVRSASNGATNITVEAVK